MRGPRQFGAVGRARGAGEQRSPVPVGPVPPASRGRGVLAPLALAAVLACASAGGARADVTVAFDSLARTVAPGDTFTVAVVIPQAGSTVNAFDLCVRFDPAMLAFVPTSPLSAQIGSLCSSACANLFHRFTPAADSVKASVTLLCGGVHVAGPGTLYRLRFRALAAQGQTSLVFGPGTEFYDAGLFVRPVHATGLAVTIGSTAGVGPGNTPGGGLEFAPPAPNPGRGGGPLLLEFSLPRPDVVSAELLDAQGRRIAGRPAESFAAGRHRFTLELPPLPSGGYFLRLRGSASGCAVRRWTALR